MAYLLFFRIIKIWRCDKQVQPRKGARLHKKEIPAPRIRSGAGLGRDDMLAEAGMTTQVREPVLPRIKHHSKTGYANVLSENYTVQLRWPKKIKGIKGAHLAILYRSTDHFTIKLNTKKYNPSLNIGIFLHIIVNLYRFPITRLKSGRYIQLKFLFFIP